MTSAFIKGMFEGQMSRLFTEEVENQTDCGHDSIQPQFRFPLVKHLFLNSAFKSVDKSTVSPNLFSIADTGSNFYCPSWSLSASSQPVLQNLGASKRLLSPPKVTGVAHLGSNRNVQ